MKILSIGAVGLILSFYISCSPSVKRDSGTVPTVAGNKFPAMSPSTTFFSQLFAGSSSFVDSVVTRSKERNLQIIYTRIDRRPNGKPRLTTHIYNEQPGYFYPASTIKLPIAILALQKLQGLKPYGIERTSTMITETALDWQTPVYNDPTSPDGRPTIEHYIKKIFLVSDNDASNRLYEFLGQEYINEQLHKRGFTEAQILHRVGIFHSAEQNRHTNPVKFYDSTGKLLFHQPAAQNEFKYEQRNDKLGIGYMSGGNLVNTPMDFSTKNRISLASLHKMVIGLVFPGSLKNAERFNINEEDRLFLLKYMSMMPTESKYPQYDSATHHSTYNKFLFYGTERQEAPKHIRIFNKIGNAYGQLVDASYFIDHKNQVEFFLSAAITVNDDGIYNDDKYEYNTIGYPFLRELGQLVYKHELQRKKNRLPDLSAFVFNYE